MATIKTPRSRADRRRAQRVCRSVGHESQWKTDGTGEWHPIPCARCGEMPNVGQRS